VEKLTQEAFNKRISAAMEPVKSTNGARPDALRTLVERARARNKQVLNKRVEK